MKKLRESIRKRPINLVLLLGVLGLYFLNNLYLKAHLDGWLQTFFVCFFNDLMCPLFFFSYANMLLLTINKEWHRLWFICLIGICVSFVWEFFAPVIKPTSTTDPLDILCYMVGSVVYWAILHLVRKTDA